MKHAENHENNFLDQGGSAPVVNNEGEAVEEMDTLQKATVLLQRTRQKLEQALGDGLNHGGPDSAHVWFCSLNMRSCAFVHR